MNEIAKGIRHKSQQTLKENRAIEYKQTRIEFWYTWPDKVTSLASFYSNRILNLSTINTNNNNNNKNQKKIEKKIHMKYKLK